MDASLVSPSAACAAAERAALRIARDRRVRLVYLFGSAVDPTRAAVHDVDLAVLTEPALSLEELWRIRADAAETAQTPLDLVLLNDASVVLAWEVATSGQCLYACDADVEVEFVTRAQARYWDFKPFLEEQWRLTGERLEERRRGRET